MPPDPAQPPLTPLRKAVLGAGIAMFFAQIAGAIALAPPTTGEGDARAWLLATMWGASLIWSTVIVLFVVQRADLPDVATASMLVTIAAFGAFTLSAAVDARGTDAEVNLVDALFLGVTGGALTAMLVWGLALGIARALGLPVSRPGDGARQ